MNSKKLFSLISMSFLALMLLSTLVFSATPDEFDDYTGCTTIIVGKDASADGSTMTSHTADCGYCDSRLIYVPAEDHKPGEMRPVYLYILGYPRYVGVERGSGYHPKAGEVPTEPLGYIPEVEHTYAYFDAVYGVMNEHQVAIGECTCGARTRANPLPEGEALFDIAAASRVAMERCTTAREAVQLMGDLCVEYGYYGSGETYTVVDGNEAWVWNILATPDENSAIWAAQRIPDDHIAVMANQFTMREIDLDNPDYFMASDNIFDVAIAQGWWIPAEGPFDFTRAYSRVYDPIRYYSLRRKWRIYDLLAPSYGFKPWVEDSYTTEYPFSIKPDKKVSVQDLFTVFRDHYEGTEFDLTKGMAAGPFGNPNRYRSGAAERLIEGGTWERAISMFRTDYTTVIQSRNWLPASIGGVMWFTPDVSATSCFTPFYAGVTELPKAYSTGNRLAFTRDSAFWAMNFVGNWADLKYSYMIKDIEAKQDELESKMLAAQPAIDEAAKLLYNQDPELARQFLTDYCNNTANSVVAEWWDLADFLIMKYIDGYVNVPKVGEGVGYPLWWLKEVGFGPLEPKK